MKCGLLCSLLTVLGVTPTGERWCLEEMLVGHHMRSLIQHLDSRQASTVVGLEGAQEQQVHQ